MTAEIYGWCGKILKINLSDSRISEPTTMDYADRFLGGRGIATRIYWEEVEPDVGALILKTGTPNRKSLLLAMRSGLRHEVVFSNGRGKGCHPKMPSSGPRRI